MQKALFVMTSLGLGFLRILLSLFSMQRGKGMTYYCNLLSNIVSLISLLLLLCFPGIRCFRLGLGFVIPIFSFLFLIKYFPRGNNNG